MAEQDRVDHLREHLRSALDDAYNHGKRDGIMLVATALRKMLEYPVLIEENSTTAVEGFKAAVELAEFTLQVLENPEK